MLWRALKSVERGFYVDVGANDPSIDSVTKAFYERGWSGINIEPLLQHYLALQNERSRDLNLQYAAGAVRGEIDLWECDVRGWASADESVIAMHSANGHQGIIHRVPVIPLSEVFADHVKGDIHFLKIDVEGFEKSVIDGVNFAIFRPWILVIESTRPNSTNESHEDWEENILFNDYLPAYFDGLNRFYVAKEHSELLVRLSYPPNVFDEFIHIEHLNSDLKAQQAGERADIAEAKAQQASERADIAEAKAQQVDTILNAVYNSSSWRLTTPLRQLAKMLKR